MAYDDDDVPPRRQKRKSKGKSRKRSSDAFKQMRTIIAGAVGCLVIFLLWSLAPVLGGGWLAKGTPLDPVVRAKAAADREVDQRGEKAFRHSIDSFVQRFGSGKHVTVTFSNVRDESKETVKYLRHRVRRAAAFDYQQELKRASEVTRANHQQARQVAEAKVAARQAEAAARAKDSPFGRGPMPGFETFEYNMAGTNLPTTSVIDGSRRNGRVAFGALPVIDLSQFVTRLGFGSQASIDQANRTVTIRLDLPSPLPDPDVEEIELKYGKGTTLMISITGDVNQGGSAALEFLAKQVSRAAFPDTKGPTGSESGSTKNGDTYEQFYKHLVSRSGGECSTTVFWVSDIEYKAVVAPVTDIQQVADRIDFGKADQVDVTSRTFTVRVQLPPQSAPQ